MNKVRAVVLSLCVAVAVGCTPEALPTASVETMSRVLVYNDEIVSVYNVCEEQHKLLRNEFENWKQAGFVGFEESFLRHRPTLLVTGTTTNGVTYRIDFGTDKVFVHEVAGTLVDGTRYARDATEADARFRQFLSACIATGQLPLLARGALPTE